LPLLTAQRLGELEREQGELAELATRESGSQAPRRIAVQAPVAGTLSAVHASRGQAVSPEAAVLTLTPEGEPLVAHLYAPSSALGFVRVGQAVKLRVQAYPHQKFGWLPGQVSAVAQAPAQTTELAQVAGLGLGAAAEPLYRITVALSQTPLAGAGAERPLRAGMQLEADVVLEQRRLVEWLFEPLLAWAKR
jgi:membrane fusion protein